jgi:hypothetical protein
MNLQMGKEVKPKFTGKAAKYACASAFLLITSYPGLAVNTDKTVSASSIVVYSSPTAESAITLQAIGGTRVRADESSDIQAIGGTRVRADESSESQAIGGTRVRAIGGTRVRAIGGTRVRDLYCEGGELQAIGGTRVRTDNGVDIQAIGGTRVRAIGGTRVRAIGGTRVRADESSESQAIGGTRVRAIGGTRVRADVTVGPIENIDWSSQTFTVMNTRISANDLPESLQPGALATAVSCGDTNQTVLVEETPEYFVAGATPITLSGTIESVDTSTATFVVNSVTVDYSSLLSEQSEIIGLETGNQVEVTGVAY